MKRAIVLFAVLTVLIGCSSSSFLNYRRAQYVISFTGTQDYLTKSQLRSYDSGGRDNAYTDSLFDFAAAMRPDHVELIVNNHSGSTIRMQWNDCSLVDFEGKSLRVVNGNVLVIDRQRSQVPNVVLDGERFSGNIYAAENIRPASDGGIIPFVQAQYSAATCDSMVGRMSKLLIAIERDTLRSEYLLTFRIDRCSQAPSMKERW